LRNTENLSGGEKRLVAIAGVLAMNPRYIALDEPTAFLDPAAAARVLEIMDKLHDAGVGIIHVTHNMAQAALAERVVALQEGRVYLDAAPREVFGKVELLQKINLHLPQITQLFVKLKEFGLPVRTDIVDIDEAANHIKKLINNA
jgi:biotin transport system ATP-binding protein/energy-coupling factor transport system ATP-binding protein